MAEADYGSSKLLDTFEKAAEHLKSILGKADSTQLLMLYAYYKQAKVGPCSGSRPAWRFGDNPLILDEISKWDEWSSLGKMSPEEAMTQYVQLISDIDPEWNDENSNCDGSGKIGWVAVSCLSNTDEYVDDKDKTIFDWVKEGNAEKVYELARKSSTDSNVIDSEGMGLIHWAADRGNLATVKCIVKDLTADIDLKDRDGQTALHYAASCGHTEIVRFLLDNGADRNVADADGLLPADVASGSEIVEALNAC